MSHLYLHLPFCRHACPYCDYPMTTATADGARWADAIGTELALRGWAQESLRTLHVGGGTPSILGAALPERVAAALGWREGERSPLLEEWGVEGNPEDLTTSVLDAWVESGVTRVVAGLQSLDDEALRWLGRRHGSEEGERALQSLAASGLETWGVDLLFGLPAEVDRNPFATLDRVVDAGAPQISLYELTWEGETDTLPEGDALADQYLSLVDRLLDSGYAGVEATSFALPGHGSRHWEAISRGASFMGAGPGAHSWDGVRRSWNLSDWGAYLAALKSGDRPVDRYETLGPEEVRLERLWADLGSRRGVQWSTLVESEAALAQGWIAEGWARFEPEESELRPRLVLTPEGWLRLDSLMLELDRLR